MLPPAPPPPNPEFTGDMCAEAKPTECDIAAGGAGKRGGRVVAVALLAVGLLIIVLSVFRGALALLSQIDEDPFTTPGETVVVRDGDQSAEVTRLRRERIVGGYPIQQSHRFAIAVSLRQHFSGH